MKRFLLLTFAALLFMTTASFASDSPYRHVVLMKFKDSATADDIKKVEEAFKALPGKIDTIVDLEWGTNVSPEGKDDGLTHCFFLTFKDKAGLEVYLPHPDHKAFGTILRPVLDKVVVVDYVASK